MAPRLRWATRERRMRGRPAPGRAPPRPVGLNSMVVWRGCRPVRVRLDRRLLVFRGRRFPCTGSPLWSCIRDRGYAKVLYMTTVFRITATDSLGLLRDRTSPFSNAPCGAARLIAVRQRDARSQAAPGVGADRGPRGEHRPFQRRHCRTTLARRMSLTRTHGNGLCSVPRFRDVPSTDGSGSYSRPSVGTARVSPSATMRWPRPASGCSRTRGRLPTCASGSRNWPPPSIPYRCFHRCDSPTTAARSLRSGPLRNTVVFATQDA